MPVEVETWLSTYQRWRRFLESIIGKPNRHPDWWQYDTTRLKWISAAISKFEAENEALNGNATAPRCGHSKPPLLHQKLLLW
jgi:hypothetical protein